MEPISLPQVFSLPYKVKAGIAEGALLALGSVFETCSKSTPELKKEMEGWPEGMVFALRILQNGPAVTLKYSNGEIKYLGKGIHGEPDLVVCFKNIDCALLVFTGQMGAHTASVQHRVIVQGDIGNAMKVVRGMAVVQMYLFPGFIVNSTFKRAPKMTLPQYLRKAGVYAGLVPNLAIKFSK